MVQFASVTNSVAEESGPALIQVQRVGNINSTVQVQYFSTNGTATAGVDYSAVAGTLIFLPGQTNLTITVPIIDDLLIEGNETVNLTPELVGEGKYYLVEIASVTMTFVEDKAVTIELSSNVVLLVTDAPEGVRGDSANNVQKAITLQTGLVIQAPLFIKTGEKIKIDTRTGKYMERA